MRETQPHPLVAEDVSEAVKSYRNRSAKAAEAFLNEFYALCDRIEKSGGGGHPCGRFRRRNFRRFPFHLLYAERGDEIWIMVVRHDSRHPSYGMSRRIPDNP